MSLDLITLANSLLILSADDFLKIHVLINVMPKVKYHRFIIKITKNLSRIKKAKVFI